MFPCPRCNRSLEESGLIDWDGEEIPVYQCGECLAKVEMFGEPFEVALTFAVRDGKAFDPASPGGVLPPGPFEVGQTGSA